MVALAEYLVKKAQLTSPYDQTAAQEEPSSGVGVQVATYLKDNPEPELEAFSAWVGKSGVDAEEALEAVLVLASKFASFAMGGKSGGKPPKGVATDQVKRGIEVEKEHTSDPLVAMKIALDHLTEFPEYYSALDKMESDLKSGGARSFMDSFKKTAADIVARRPMGRKLARVRDTLKTPPRSERQPESNAGFDPHGNEIGTK
jgi:hypothetical protein